MCNVRPDCARNVRVEMWKDYVVVIMADNIHIGYQGCMCTFFPHLDLQVLQPHLLNAGL